MDLRRHATRCTAIFRLLLLSLLAFAPSLPAQDYPQKDRPIRFINPYAPGGQSDPVLRPIVQKLAETWGQKAFIENKPGAGTNIGGEYVAKSPPDGYTLLLATTPMAINVHINRAMPFDPVKDLAPVVMLTDVPNALAVHVSVPVKTVRELIDYARANPGRLSYGSSGNGGTNHLGMERLKGMAHLDIVHVPYKGGGPAMVDLVAGQVQVMLSPPAALLRHEEAGRVRVLAVASAERIPGLALPTVAETLPGYSSGVWMALFAPAGTPRPIIDRLNGEVNRLLKDPQVVRLYNSAMMPIGGGSPEDLATRLAADIELYGRLVKATGTKLD